jgi:Holliday junction DNA helicase RuvA
MIGRLRGTLIEKQAPDLIIDVHGVGYEVSAPMTTFYQLPETGNEITLHTHLVVREDAQQLYGFISLADRELFRTLIKVSGVGAKLALALLSGISADDLVLTVRSGDASALTRIPGVGKKTAERLIVEMRDRLAEWEVQGAPEAAAVTLHSGSGARDDVRDAVSALIALGYKPQEASRMVRQIETAGLASEEIIRQALQSVTT